MHQAYNIRLLPTWIEKSKETDILNLAAYHSPTSMSNVLQNFTVFFFCGADGEGGGGSSYNHLEALGLCTIRVDPTVMHAPPYQKLISELT